MKHWILAKGRTNDNIISSFMEASQRSNGNPTVGQNMGATEELPNQKVAIYYKMTDPEMEAHSKVQTHS